MSSPARIAVFVSGGGTNLQSLLDHFNGKSSPVARVELVVASREGIGAIERARAAGVQTGVIDPAAAVPEAIAAEMLERLTACGIDLIVLAGYLKLVPSQVLEAYPDRILNIHPALLPAFGGPGMYGIRVHRAVIESGATVSGATVHRVGERYDEGPIVAQWPVPVLRTDTPESLAARVLRVEHILLPAAIEAALIGAPAPAPTDDTIFDLAPGLAPRVEAVRRILH